MHKAHPDSPMTPCCNAEMNFSSAEGRGGDQIRAAFSECGYAYKYSGCVATKANLRLDTLSLNATDILKLRFGWQKHSQKVCPSSLRSGIFI